MACISFLFLTFFTWGRGEGAEGVRNRIGARVEGGSRERVARDRG